MLKLQTHEPGIYFDMPEAEYHADESLSATGSKNLLVSPLTFWTRSRFNPNRRDEETPAMAFGKACDKLIVEGPEAFSMAYAVRPCLEDHPEALDGAEDLRARCAELGLKKGGTIAQLCDRILEADQNAMLWPRILQDWAANNADKIAISADWYRDIVNRAQLVRNHGIVAKAFQGGYPQVSIFWINRHGVPMKARIDYLKTKIALDLKTFSNGLNKPVSVAVAHAMAYQRYGIQAVIYMDGIETIKAMLRRGTPVPCHGNVDGNWLDAFVATDEHQFGFVFVESGDVPNVLARRFRKHMPSGGLSLAYTAADTAYQMASFAFDEWFSKCGRDPWIGEEPMRDFEDEEFPMWTMEAA
jgi:PDDEXK-like uncharacterized protein DUF3799